jgi:hypothetical protein
MMWEILSKLFGAREADVGEAQEPKFAPFVRCIDGPDSRRKLFIRKSGVLFTWEVETFVEYDDGEWGTLEYWTPTDAGGLYGSADEAEADARKSIFWLREKREDQDRE